jgi:integrase
MLRDRPRIKTDVEHLRLGIRHRRPYNCRHTYATMMLMSGMTPAFCAKQLGHAVEVFHAKYARWLDGAHDDLERARFEESLGAIGTPVVHRLRVVAYK